MRQNCLLCGIFIENHAKTVVPQAIYQIICQWLNETRLVRAIYLTVRLTSNNERCACSEFPAGNTADDRPPSSAQRDRRFCEQYVNQHKRMNTKQGALRTNITYTHAHTHTVTRTERRFFFSFFFLHGNFVCLKIACVCTRVRSFREKAFKILRKKKQKNDIPGISAAKYFQNIARA